MTRSAPNGVWPAAMPALFVLLWSTGFIGAKLGLPYAESMTFLTLRFAAAVAILIPLALLLRAPWPGNWRQAGHIAFAGLLIHGAYLGGIYGGIQHGIEVGTSALIVGLQPLVVALFAGWFLGERTTKAQWLGVALGVIGVALVVWRKLSLDLGTPTGVGLHLVALLGISAGMLYQKCFCSDMNLLSGSALQLAAAALLVGLLALFLESWEIDWTGEFVFAFVWLVVVLSIGGFMLFYALIKRGAAARVSSLFFLVPPTTALIAWPLFGETLGAISIAGMVLAVTGVALINWRRREAAG
ncbi:MAG: DMT family transporter [Alphaproteobacteria bacterium]|nr:DMT family transporter [Alphaproteobacteria bacterium]MDP6818045.1 DMT family transporter [Alphaproteobacteria bacterium]